MKEELKKYLKDHECFVPLKVSHENYILLAIDRFFDQYQPERSKREDSNKFYVLWQIGPISGNPNREGEVDSKQEAQKWVDAGISCGYNRCWHEHTRDAVL